MWEIAQARRASWLALAGPIKHTKRPDRKHGGSFFVLGTAERTGMVWQERVFGRRDVLRDRLPVAVTLGVFDGVHRGHVSLLSLLQTAGEGLPAVVVTFDPHPDELFGVGSPLLLMSLEERVSELLRQGVATVVVETFSREFANLSAREFCVNYLAAHYVPRQIVLGYDFRFGCDRAGNAAFLRSLGNQLGWMVQESEPCLVGNVVVSSSEIRRLLMDGSVAEANNLLGRPFSVSGLISSGEQRGREMGFPTVNLENQENLPLRDGVYVGQIASGADFWRAVVNVGCRPTFGFGLKRRVEAHALEPLSAVPGESIRIRFLSRIRDERRFESGADLKKAISRDVSDATAWFQQSPTSSF